MKYAIADFDQETGIIDDSNLVWCEGSQEEAERVVKEDHTKCTLFYYKDVNRGFPVKPEATRKEFEANPAFYGSCFYHCCVGYRYE